MTEEASHEADHMTEAMQGQDNPDQACQQEGTQSGPDSDSQESVPNMAQATTCTCAPTGRGPIANLFKLIGQATGLVTRTGSKTTGGMASASRSVSSLFKAATKLCSLATSWISKDRDEDEKCNHFESQKKATRAAISRHNIDLIETQKRLDSAEKTIAELSRRETEASRTLYKKEEDLINVRTDLSEARDELGKTQERVHNLESELDSVKEALAEARQQMESIQATASEGQESPG